MPSWLDRIFSGAHTIFLLAVLCAAPYVALADEAAPMMDDPRLEKRMNNVAGELRCLVCQGQSLADSHSDFAADLRHEMYTLMKDGKSDTQVVDYFVARYGDFIRYRPPMKSTTVVLWFGPLLLFILAASVLGYNLAQRRKRVGDAPPLSEEEQRRAQALLATEVSTETKVEPKA